MKLPSCTVRTRRTFGSKDSVSEMVDNWDTPVIDIGTVYEPPPTLNSVPGGVTSTSAAANTSGRAGGVSGSTGTADRGARATGGVRLRVRRRFRHRLDRRSAHSTGPLGRWVAL